MSLKVGAVLKTAAKLSYARKNLVFYPSLKKQHHRNKVHSYTLVLERTVDDKAFRLTLVTCMNKMAAKNVSLNREGSQRRFTMVYGLAASLSPFR